MRNTMPGAYTAVPVTFDRNTQLSQQLPRRLIEAVMTYSSSTALES